MVTALTMAAKMPDALEGIPPEVRRWLWLLLGAFTGAVLLADMVVLALHLVGARRGTPLLAPRWSVADLLLGLQLVVWLLVAGAFVLCIPLGVLQAARPALPSDQVMSGVTLLILVWQNVAMVVTTALFVVLKYGEPVRAAGLSLRGWWKGIALGCLAALVTVPLSDLLDQLTQVAMKQLGTSTAQQVVEALTHGKR
jgi:hypothetical protein